MNTLDICPLAPVLSCPDNAKTRRRRARTALLQLRRPPSVPSCYETTTSSPRKSIKRSVVAIDASDVFSGYAPLTDPLTSIITSSALTLLCLRLIDAYRMHAPSDEQDGSQQKREYNRTKTSESQEETDSRKSFRENFRASMEEDGPQSIADVWTAAWAPFESNGSPNDRVGQSTSNRAQLMSLNTPLLYIQGLRISSRQRLLKHSLTALQRQLSTFQYDSTMLLEDSMWPDLCLTILKSACIEAAELWLGYVPSELRKAVILEKSDPIKSEETSMAPSTVIELFAIQERMPMYCSTVCLLRSSQVQQQHSTSQLRSIQGWQATLNDQSSSSLLRFAPNVLHDMAIRIADLVASAYLQEATNAKWSVDPSSTNQSSETQKQNKELAIPEAFISLEPSWWASFAHPRLLSTRQLQRFLNRISLFRWLYSNVTSVAAVLEDRLPLIILSKAKTGPALLRVFNLPMRRSKELSSLNGLRYAVSLAMEAMDILAPLTVMLWAKTRQVVVWVLVQWLGKGVGLLWQGIREGLNAKNVSTRRHRATKRTKPTEQVEDWDGLGWEGS